MRGLTIERPNQVWCADITYIPIGRGFLYLVAIMDWASRAVLSWRLSNTRTAKHLLASRPIFHKLDETIRGHVFCSFLALVLKKALEDRIAALDRAGS